MAVLITAGVALAAPGAADLDRIAVLLAIVVLSYSQGVKAYASSGGSYVFARENLGTLPALVAGAALLTDYVLTVAVSVAAGVFAITSAAPSLAPHQLALSLACVALLTVGNLRGVRESGLLFAFPTYGFIAILYLTLGIGVAKCTVGTCPVATVPHPLAAGTGALGVFLLLKAFSSGAVALTGVESISNGVTAFRPPQARNAARTLYVMAAIAISFFVTVSWLAVKMDARPSSTRLGALADRARRVPGRLARLGRLLPRPGVHARDPRAGGEHLVPGLPAPGRAARARPLPARASSSTSATGSRTRTGSSSWPGSRPCCWSPSGRTSTR